MDVKARSKAMREILTRLVDIEKGGVDVKIFGDPVILEEGQSMQGIGAATTVTARKVNTVNLHSQT